MKTIRELTKEKPWLNWLIFFITLAVVFIIGLFAASIVERRSEAQLYFQMVQPIPDFEPDNSVWGVNFPRQYQSYLKTLDTTFESKYYGSVMIDYLEKYPELVVMWAGYAFSRDYNQGRGHYYSVKDVHNTLRTGVPQPGTCWTCKSTDVPRLMNEMGVEKFYSSTWEEIGKHIEHPIGCQDCHDPSTMNLRITRPALTEAFKRRGVDIANASLQEMRSLVCAQCHVEYYFKGDGNYLTFPWDDGLSVEDMEYYFDRVEHVDWVHTLSRAPMLKTQHPDYELFKTGIHYKRGVSCADCHMPYKREGGIKFTDHHISSPLDNIENSCQVCHREAEAELRANIYEIQSKVSELRKICEKNLATLHIEAKHAWENGASEEEMAPILQLIRHAQWRWDFIAAANSMGFHSPNESLRVLGTSIQKSQEARIKLATLFGSKGWEYPVDLPDISTKEKAQKYIGLDMLTIRKEKEDFKNNILPDWIQQRANKQ